MIYLVGTALTILGVLDYPVLAGVVAFLIVVVPGLLLIYKYLIQT